MLRLAVIGLALVGTLGVHSPLDGQTAPVQLHLIPQLGAGTSFSNPFPGQGIYGTSLDVFTMGAEIEAVIDSRWTPSVAVHHWRVRDGRCEVDACTTGGWSGEVGMIRSWNARSIVRPFGGAGLGLREMAETGPYVLGRAGVDFTPRQSPLTVRAEGRYHRFSGSPGSVFLLSTGIRFAIGG